MTSNHHHFDFATLPTAQRYKLLVGLVVPRPIALVSTRSRSGVANAAPFSFFNVIGDEPPIVIISIENRNDGRMKDSSRNILERGEFVVNLVDEDIAAPMHASAEDFGPEISEFAQVGFTEAACRNIDAPRIAEAPVSLECVLHSKVPMETRHLIIGKIVAAHVRAGIIDLATLRVIPDAYRPIGRFYANRYVRTRDQFTIEANTYNAKMSTLGRS